MRSQRDTNVSGISLCQVLPAAGRRCRLVLLVAAVVFAVGLWLTARVTFEQGLSELAAESGYRLELYVSYLQGVLGKYESLPELLAVNGRLVAFLRNPGDRGRIEALNRYLATINRISDAADTYLMDREGLTIAASNWNAERPFVGRNFSYRPYFQQAMRGRLGRYFALGIASNRRGYYFAYPVRSKGEILGAVVVKVDIDQVEHDWGRRDESFLVTDPDGVIFLSTNPAWRFFSLTPLDAEVLKRIRASRRYPEAPLHPLPLVSRTKTATGTLVSLGHGRERREYLQLSKSMDQAGWQVHILSDTRHIHRLVWRTLVGAAAAGILLVLALLVVMQQRLRTLERRSHEEEQRRMLEAANEALEQRVRDRTRELQEANAKLLLEIEDRKEVEEKLRHARKEVIHTAKLAAIGQMATGINHELSQPLAAIRAYGDNGRAFLDKGRLEEARENFLRIVELTERMAGIGAQLRIFSRKSQGEVTCLPLRPVVDGALEVLHPLLQRTRITPEIRLAPEQLCVRANSLLLQQALVNLMSNSLHALEERENAHLLLLAEGDGHRVRIRVCDNGPGIPSRERERVFEPFYTTKPAGQGLGLGLTITRRIIEDMGGTIRITERGQSTCLEISLPGCAGDKADTVPGA